MDPYEFFVYIFEVDGDSMSSGILNGDLISCFLGEGIELTLFGTTGNEGYDTDISDAVAFSGMNFVFASSLEDPGMYSQSFWP